MQATPRRQQRGTVATGAASACAACGLLAAGRLAAGSSEVDGSAFVAASASPAQLRGRTAAALAAEDLRAPTSQLLSAKEAAAAPASGASSWLAGGLAATVAAGTFARREVRRRKADGASRARNDAARIVKALSDQAVEVKETTVQYNEDQPVQKTSVLVLGATGTLGRQVVRQLLNAGYSVRCMLRNRVDRPFSFLLDWGATVVQGSLTQPESLPSALIGIHTVVDCATARAEESAFNIDWEGKKAFIQCCHKMKIQRYVFCSIKDCDKYPNVPLMNIKAKTEDFLQKSKLRYTNVRLSGFMQPLISQYALNVLDEQKVWGDDGQAAGIAYVDSNDAARFITAVTTKEGTIGKTLYVSGPKVWTTGEVIQLCEKLSGRQAEVDQVSTTMVQATQAAASFFEWSIDVAERLRFIEVTGGSQAAAGVMNEDTYKLLGMEQTSTRQLEEYIGEYYKRVFKMLTAGKYEPDDGEQEAEKAEEDRKLQMAINKLATDSLPAGQPEEEEVTIQYQREMSDRIQMLFEDRGLDVSESGANNWFGWTGIAELLNGRFAMTGIALGLFSEWATGQSFPSQISGIIDIFSAPGQ
eukprot:TRINITY_DN111735_c0_g1_i1.p1 TRINITY_DN111735_c0_g1~~TRINITY_DN111735_c0_g1_i1.p1  ORF type:complete len:585 (+),score=212.04 TRINITY_DN111735_c0_g1_i1:80-1834(+)